MFMPSVRERSLRLDMATLFVVMVVCRRTARGF
jgi:hypothetical protein